MLHDYLESRGVRGECEISFVLPLSTPGAALAGNLKGPDRRAIVEGADDRLLAALADPVARPECVEPGVDNEHGVAFGEIAHHTRHILRMNAVLAARGIGLLVLHLVPGFARAATISKNLLSLLGFTERAMI
jgi:hypothetical protein